ncbi:phospholipase A2 family protein [Caldalkalibacillus mannanilyticus]|uniref:phospholipase A2 family protein n=1 Tax=Caldalkalibacillus mannanilyticus TaxID=1418 RepID=UPI000468D54F|nr:phospholipase A2 family protein [Caldalkalibacillus mannanilyticus]
MKKACVVFMCFILLFSFSNQVFAQDQTVRGEMGAVSVEKTKPCNSESSTSVAQNEKVTQEKPCYADQKLEELKDEEAIKILEELEQYIVLDKENQVSFDEKKAVENGASPEVIEVGRNLNSFAQAVADYAVEKDELSPEALKLPIYGNWCGPGHGGGTPIDHLDRGCMQHDKCYEREGYFSCNCDTNLINYITTGIANKSFGSGVQYYMALAIRAYFKIAPCR